MNINSLPMVVYHGTASSCEKSLLNGIDLSCSNKYVDFGRGFYTTSNYQQALRFAKARAEKDNTSPLIISYNVNKSLFSNLKILIFDKPDNKWSEFVYNNRMPIEKVMSEYHNKESAYDIVYGGVADGSIGYYIKESKKNAIDFMEFSRSIKPPLQDTYNQMSFHTEAAINCLSIRKCELIK